MNADPAPSPMMAQYLEIKAGHADALLFYRMGDFYEMFFDDAVAAASALDIALTKRGVHEGKEIPMCGVPVHSAEGYLLNLIRKGFRVAVAEQMEDPAEARKRGSKAVVHREVVRLVTPGTLTEEALLEARRSNLLASICDVRGTSALCWTDMSTGEMRVLACTPAGLAAQLARLGPSEILLAEGAEPDLERVAEGSGAALTRLSNASFDSSAGAARLCALHGVGDLGGFGSFDRAELGAMGAVVEYLDLTQKGRLPLLHPPIQERAEGSVAIDAATRRNLELTSALSGGRAGSLLHAIDRTATAAGARLLERRVAGPSTDLAEIAARHEAVAALVEAAELRADLRRILRRVPDIERALARLGLGRGGPRDLGALRAGLSAAAAITELLAKTGALPPRLAEVAGGLRGEEPLRARLDAVLAEDLPTALRDGGVIAAGVDGDLDAARRLRDDGRSVIAALQAEYAGETGIAALKIRHNNVLGYFIETPATHAAKMLAEPLSGRFIHRQTTANALRFTTLDLSQTERDILNAGARALEIERRLFEELREAVVARSGTLGVLARALAELDVSAAWAEIAVEGDWCRPSLDTGRDLVIEAGRHPVVEAALRREGAPFVPNDLALGVGSGQARLLLLTGPNMAGKSTYLRQCALIVLLAQAGGFVPAAAARIGLVSQIFSRVGAADDLARGRSTFMVEMVETAAILNQADERALVILDEIGRGTATHDGLAIAWAVLEHLHEVNRCRALFATHYHELTGLAQRLDGLTNAAVAVKEHEGDVVFLHEVRPGAADRSYGVQVARLAGLPPAAVARAREVLDRLEAGERAGGRVEGLVDDLPLFAALPARRNPAPTAVDGPAQRLAAHLANVNPDTLSPREALDLVYELRGLLAED